MRFRIPATLSLLVALTFALASRAENLQQLNQLLSTKECQKCELRGTGLVLSDLSGADLSGADLSDANLSRANLTGAKLKNANLSRASLLGANLTGADLSGANLTQTDLNSTNLSGANLSKANLMQADLRKAYLVDANLRDTNLENAYLRGAVGIPTYALKAEDFYAMGVDEAQRGNHRGAIEQFNQSLTVDPKYTFAYMGRAISRKQLGDQDGAVQDSQAAEKLYEEQKDAQGLKIAKDLTEGLKKKPDEAGGGDTFGAIVNTIGSVLLQFLLK